MTTLAINIPDDINRDLEQLNLPKEEVVLSAVQSYLLQKKQEQLNLRLKEGYQSSHQENKNLAQEFSTIDLCNWHGY